MPFLAAVIFPSRKAFMQIVHIFQGLQCTGTSCQLLVFCLSTGHLPTSAARCLQFAGAVFAGVGSIVRLLRSSISWCTVSSTFTDAVF
eukprot:5196039-Pleurochrysis_carterae.AAC.1